MVPERKVIQWTPGVWWVVDDRAQERGSTSYTPIAGPFPNRKQAKEALADTLETEQP